MYRKAVYCEVRTVATNVPTLDKAKIIFVKENIWDKNMKIKHSKPLTSQESCVIHQYDQGIQGKKSVEFMPVNNPTMTHKCISGRKSCTSPTLNQKLEMNELSEEVI